MTTKSLEYFLVVVKHLNISKAAKELFISQPALSKQISQLEAELGVSLFDRTKHSLKLTHAGEVLLSETNELFKKQDELRQRVRAAGNVSEDALRLCHMPGALNYHVADILAQFQEKYPEIDFIPAPPTDSTCGCNDCEYMKLVTLPKIYDALVNESPEVVIDEEVRRRAEGSIRNMLGMSK